MAFSLIARPWVPAPADGADHDPHLRLAILGGARSILQAGWLQGAWYTLEAPDGRRHVVGAGSLTPRSRGIVVQACLVGAVVEAGRRHTPERGVAGSAIDALWTTLVEAEGGRVPEHRTPSPVVRRLEVRDLARWNDRPGRTHAQVLGLVDTTLARLATSAPAAALSSPASAVPAE